LLDAPRANTPDAPPGNALAILLGPMAGHASGHWWISVG
jgi:hypothetical protein